MSGYEDVFTDFETMLINAAKKGFVQKDYSLLYMFFLKRKGVEYADTWFKQNNKVQKRLFCANTILRYEMDEGLRASALNYVNKINKVKN